MRQTTERVRLSLEGGISIFLVKCQIKKLEKYINIIYKANSKYFFKKYIPFSDAENEGV